MKNYKYNGDFGAEIIGDKEIVWVKNKVYSLNENEDKVKQFVAQKKLIEVAPAVSKKKGQK